jgi:hypothetical protein
LNVSGAVASPTISVSDTLTSPLANLTRGTITADSVLLNTSVTWNAAGIVGPAWRLNVTDTSSNAAALLADLQVGGVSKWKVDKTGAVTQTGRLIVPDGTAALPGYAFAGVTNTGLFRESGSFIGFSHAGTAFHMFHANNYKMGSVTTLGWVPSTNVAGATGMDLILARDAANTLAQRNGTTAQIARIYRTFTDASNYERLEIFSDSPNFYIQTQNAGTGTAKNLLLGSQNGAVTLGTAAGNIWQMTTTGHFVATTDNAFDIGAAAATRPRNVHVAGNVVTGAATTGTNQVGAVFPGSVLFAALSGTATNGQVVYCSDCTLANPCAGSGTGAIAKRLNAVWICN